MHMRRRRPRRHTAAVRHRAADCVQQGVIPDVPAAPGAVAAAAAALITAVVVVVLAPDIAQIIVLDVLYNVPVDVK